MIIKQRNFKAQPFLYIVYHIRCNFCRHSTRPYDSNVGVVPVNYMHRENEIRQREEISCEFCFEKLSDKYVRIRHENTEHRKSQAKDFKCPDCKKCYSNKNAVETEKGIERSRIKDLLLKIAANHLEELTH